MPNIHHIDQLPYSEAMKFIAPNYIDDESEFLRVTEKIDGSNVSICLIDEQLYIKSKKGKPTRDVRVFRELSETYETPIMLEFCRFLECILFQEKNIIQLFKKHNIDQLFGELVPYSQPNIIDYDPALVGNGVFYIFDELSPSILNPLNNYIGLEWRVLYSKNLDIRPVIDFRESLTYFMLHNAGDLLCRKRDAESLTKKQDAKVKYEQLLKSWKTILIDSYRKTRSVLGAEHMEGVVITNTDENVSIKVVDTENFSEIRSAVWAGTDCMKKERKELFKKLIEAFGNPDILTNEAKQEQKIVEILEDISGRIHHMDSIIDIISTDAQCESNIEATEIINRSIKLLNEYILDLLRIPDKQGPSLTAIKTELKKTFELLETLEIQTDVDDIVSFILGYKRLEELSKYLK